MVPHMQNLWIVSRYLSGMLFGGALLFAAVLDAKTREIPDVCHLMLLMSGLLGILAERVYFWDALAGMLCNSLFCLSLTLWKEDGFGGGDIKLIGAASFCLGMLASAYALVFSMMAAIIYVLLRRLWDKTKGQAVAFAPFLSAGCCLLYFQK